MLVLASAALALEAREKRVPIKDQLAAVVTGPDLAVQLAHAERARLDMADHRAYLDGVRARLSGSSQARQCLDAAFVGCQLTATGQPTAERCAITQAPEECGAFVLFGNGPKGRTEVPCVLSAPACRLIQACMVVGNLLAWLDAGVEAALAAGTRTLGTAAELDALVVELGPAITSFTWAARYLYVCCKGPIPQSREETRQAALQKWEAPGNTIHTLIRAAHEILWPDCAWKASPPTDTPEQLRRAYKALSKRVHPDKVAGERKDEAERLFRTLHEAYEAAQ